MADLVSEARRAREQMAAEGGTGFRFIWSGMVVRGELVESDTQGAALTLTCDLGPLPYTAEDPIVRLQILKALAKPPPDLPARLRLAPGQRLEFTNVTRFEAWPRAAQLIHGLIIILMQMRPHLALFRGLTQADRRARMPRPRVGAVRARA